ncbi:hypothetical protein F4808DRAFT_408136 [Astrocystis sublimbata]|nr:hypothetical protein F4808DRAFT_408136 [Astrocystis sublimbata]
MRACVRPRHSPVITPSRPVTHPSLPPLLSIFTTCAVTKILACILHAGPSFYVHTCCTAQLERHSSQGFGLDFWAQVWWSGSALGIKAKSKPPSSHVSESLQRSVYQRRARGVLWQGGSRAASGPHRRWVATGWLYWVSRREVPKYLVGCNVPCRENAKISG